MSTIPSLLKQLDNNYLTAHLGKWHITMEPEEIGFDYDEGMKNNSDGNVYRTGTFKTHQFDKQAKKFIEEHTIPGTKKTNREKKISSYWSDDNPKDVFGLTNRAKDFMRDAMKKEKPFYVQISHYATHFGLSSTNETYKYFLNKSKDEGYYSSEFAAML